MTNFFNRYKSPLAVLVLLIITSGLYFYTRMQTSLFPDITFPKIKIIADAGEQPVGKMMVTVTRQLENAVKLVPDLVQVRSITSRGSCEISAFMNWNTDIDLGRQNIESRINQVRNDLPPGVQITVEKMNPSILPVMGYTLESASRTPIELKQLALYTVRPFLSQVLGIAEIRIIGGKNKEYWITLDPKKMTALGLNTDKIASAISQTNFINSNGYLADYRRLYLSVTNTTVNSLDDLNSLIVSNDGKRTIQLKDVGQTGIKEGIEYIRINANGHEALLIAVIKQPNSNLVDVSRKMEARIGALRDVLPADIVIKPYYKQADFVNDAVKSVTDSLWIGLALAIIVAVLFLRSARASACLLISIPVTLLLTITILYTGGFTLNIMTLGAIAAAIGLVIDDAIVVVEQIHRTREEHPAESSPVVVSKAMTYLLPAMVGSSLSTIVIFLPFRLMSGVAGAYFNVLTHTMIITLVCSFFVSWLCLPAIYLLVRIGKEKQSDKAVAHEVHNQTWVYPFIRHPWISVVFTIFLIASIGYIYPKLATGFLPEMDEGSIVMDYSSPPGTSLEETDHMLREAEKLIVKVPEVAAYSRRTGTQMGFFITEPNKGDYLIQLKKNRTRKTDEVIDDLRKQISAQQPALRIDFGQVIGDMLGDLMASVQPIEIKIFGNDQTQLNKLSTEVAGIVGKVPGTADAFDGIVIAGPSIEIKPDQNKLAQFHISPTSFQQEMQAHLEGVSGGGILEREQLTPLRILYSDSRSRTLESLKQARVFLPDGRLIPITELATITLTGGNAELQRQDLQSMGVVTARRNQRDIGSVMTDIKRAVSKQVVIPSGYHLEYGGEYADQQRSFQELLLILISSSLLVFGVILFLSRDFMLAVLVLFISVLGAAGALIALFITKTPLNVGSYTGIVMIVGIIGENAIFTWWQYRQTRLTHGVEESVVYAISTRLRPKLMTALGAIVALMPLALGIGVGAQLHQPLAIAVIGGFITALPLLLVVYPSFLARLHRSDKPADVVVGVGLE